MLLRRSVRSTGSGVNHGRYRLTQTSITRRDFSLHHTSRCTRPSAPSRLLQPRQARALSLWGWDTSSKPTDDKTFAATHQANGPNASNASIPVDQASSAPIPINQTKTVKASHATSDTPDPTAAQPHGGNEPQIVQEITNAVSLPSGSEKASEILLGETDISAAPERLGYLKDVCGLDYGWGPTAFMEWTLEQLHVNGGLTWATSILVVGVVTRLIMIKPMINAQKESAKIKELKPIIDPLRDKARKLMREDRQKALEISQEMRMIQKEYNVRWSRVIMPLVLQLPLQFGAFRFLRAAGQLPVPAFTTESWLWNYDLSFSDPFYITPAISAGFIWWQFKSNQKSVDLSASPMGPEVMKILGNVLPVVSFAFMSFQPGSVQLYFMVTAVGATLTTTAMRQNWFRRYVGLPEETPKSAVAVGSVAPSNPGGLQSRPRTIKVQPETNASQGPDRSRIDQLVEKGKKYMQDRKPKPGKSTEDVRADKAARYEHEQSQRIQVERELRNKASRNKSRF